MASSLEHQGRQHQLDDHELLAGVRQPPPSRRASRRPLRRPPHVHDRPRPLHPRLRRRRAASEPAPCSPPAPLKARRRDALPRRARHHHGARSARATRAHALAAWGAVGGAGAAIGVLLGGADQAHRLAGDLPDQIPVGLGVAVAAHRILPTTPPHPAATDSTSAARSRHRQARHVVFALSQASDAGWSSDAVLGPAAAGVAGLVAVVLAERRTAHPLLNIDRLTDRGVGGGLPMMLAASSALFGLVPAGVAVHAGRPRQRAHPDRSRLPPAGRRARRRRPRRQPHRDPRRRPHSDGRRIRHRGGRDAPPLPRGGRRPLPGRRASGPAGRRTRPRHSPRVRLGVDHDRRARRRDRDALRTEHGRPRDRRLDRHRRPRRDRRRHGRRGRHRAISDAFIAAAGLTVWRRLAPWSRCPRRPPSSPSCDSPRASPSTRSVMSTRTNHSKARTSAKVVAGALLAASPPPSRSSPGRSPAAARRRHRSDPARLRDRLGAAAVLSRAAATAPIAGPRSRRRARPQRRRADHPHGRAPRRSTRSDGSGPRFCSPSSSG